MSRDLEDDRALQHWRKERGEEWYQNVLPQREEMERQRLDREFAEFKGKPQYVADALIHIIKHTTAEYEDLPQNSPLTTVDDFEWRAALALVERHREEQCAGTVDRLTGSRYAKELPRELNCITRHAQYAESDTLVHYITQLRRAQDSYSAIADAIDCERVRIEALQKKGESA